MTQLKRTLTWRHGTAMAVGAVLGSGILILPSITAEQAGPAALVAWVLMSLLAFPIALTLGQLGALVPEAGGIAAYAQAAFGGTVGRLTGWLFLGTVPVGVPIVALVGANYVGQVIPLSHTMTVMVASAMVICSLFLNYRGIQLAGFAQVLIVIVIAGMLVAAVAAASSHVQAANFTPVAPHGWLAVGGAALSIFWCFVGWEMIAHLAEEFRQPERDLRLIFIVAPLVVGILYVSIVYVTVGSHAYGAAAGAAPLSRLIGEGFGKMASDLTGALAFLITFGAVHTNIAGFSRLVYAQARDGNFPRSMARLHRKYQTPVGALLGLALPFTAVLTTDAFLHVDLGTLIRWPSIVFLVLYMVAMAAAIRLLPRGRRWMAVIGLVACVILYPFSGWACVYPPILVAVGYVAMRANRRRRRAGSFHVTGSTASEGEHCE